MCRLKRCWDNSIFNVRCCHFKNIPIFFNLDITKREDISSGFIMPALLLLVSIKKMADESR